MSRKTQSVIVRGAEIHVTTHNDQDYISLTDMTRHFEGGEQPIKNWLQNKNTIDFLGIWERINNANFNLLEFHQIKTDAGLNRFTMSVKTWTQRTGGVGLIAKAGRYGGTFAHKDIAFEFGSWLSPEFKLYLIKEFQRLKEQEISSGNLEWNLRRSLTKIQYRIHSDAIKSHLIPAEISEEQAGYIYASEADLLNTALFGLTAKQWRNVNPGKDGNLRDDATVEQLVVLASLESQNALLIEQGHPQKARLALLNELARKQMKALLNNPTIKKIQNKPLLN